MTAIRDVSYHINGSAIVSDISLSLDPSRKIGLVGPNGVGKSTLLKIWAGLIKPTHGTVQLDPGELVSYVPQDFAVTGHQTVIEYLKRRTGLYELEQVINTLTAEGIVLSMEQSGQLAASWDQIGVLGAYEFEGNLDQTLDHIGLPNTIVNRRLDELSGGQQVRIGLAGVLLSRFPVQLLDEPTNNLDLQGIKLLEEYVANSPASMVIVSHDRRFLDRTVTGIAELDAHSRQLTFYGIGYSAYREARANARAAQSDRYQNYLEEVQRLKSAIVVKTAATRSGGKPANDSDKLGYNHRTERGNTSDAGAARRLIKQLGRLPEVEQPPKDWDLQLQLTVSQRSGDQVVRITNASVSYPDFKLGPVTLGVDYGDRIAITGPNGSGKSTLVKIITGELSPETGTMRHGENVSIGLVEQNLGLVTGDRSVIDTFRHEVALDESDARTLIAKFGLSASHVNRSTKSLSPGERSRLMLAILMARGANLLILDEPTNHLDLEAQEELEAAVLQYPGTIIVVSHDREFLERIGIHRVLQVEDGCVTEGNSALIQ